MYAENKDSFLDIAKRYYGNVMSRGFINSIFHHGFQSVLPLYKVYVKKFRNSSFKFNGVEYKYFIDRYSCTWSNERAVEVPIFVKILDEALKNNNKVLEIGRVLDHYLKNSGKWDVLDKYEEAEGVLNEDMADYIPSEKYDLVISISTMEHVGFEEEDGDAQKIIPAINNVLNNVVSRNGNFVFSVPLGFNSFLDGKIYSDALPTKNIKYLKRQERMKWYESNLEEVRGSVYGDPYYVSANAIAVISNKTL